VSILKFYRTSAAAGIWGWLYANCPSILLTAVLDILWIYSSVIFLLHSSLVLTNATSYECMKGPYKVPYLKGTEECDLPFSNGLFNNIFNFCCMR
jgi:hypothetical protein